MNASPPQPPCRPSVGPTVSLLAALLLAFPAGHPLHAESRDALISSFEAQSGSDLLLTQGITSYQQVRGVTDWKITLAGATTEIDFESGGARSTHLSARRLSFQLDGKLELAPRLQGLAAASSYDGFGSYRSLWLNEYYRQLFGNPDFGVDPAYRKAHPHGYAFTTGGRWEYSPPTGILESTVTYGRDVIAPGYSDYIDVENNFRLVRLRDDLDTFAWQVAAENILTSHLRSRVEFRLSSQSLRELRYGGTVALNWALTDHWVARIEGGYMREDYAPDPLTQAPGIGTFEARWGAATVEFHPAENWYIGVSSRYYNDTGEIENSISASSATPALTAWSVGLGVRWIHGNHSVHLYAAPYFTELASARGATVLFGQLYRDRALGTAQIAYAYEF